MRHVRLLAAVVAARFRGPLTVEEESKLTFRVWPTDVDVSIANHAAVLTVMETGRIDFMIRTGFFGLARSHHWYFPLRTLRVLYLRPLKMLEKAELTTGIVHADDDGIYIRHAIRRDGKDVALALAKGAVKHGRDRVPLDRIASELGIRRWPRFEGDAADLLEREERWLRESPG